MLALAFHAWSGICHDDRDWPWLVAEASVLDEGMVYTNDLYNATGFDSQCRAVQLRSDSDKPQRHWTSLWVLALLPVLVPVSSNKDDNKHLDPAVFRALRHVSGPTKGLKPAFQLLSWFGLIKHCGVRDARLIMLQGIRPPATHGRPSDSPFIVSRPWATGKN